MKPCILLDGAFDPLHAGHVDYILSANAAFPEYEIVVSIASDDDVRAKGREPIFDQVTRGRVVGQLKGVDRVIFKDKPTEHLIGELKPAAYVKGADWTDRLPAEQLTACALYDVQIVYLNTVQDSSSNALRRWALSDAERGVSRLETFMANQTTPTFDAEYFKGAWRGNAPFTAEARLAIETPHADILASVFDGCSVLDYGCGPGILMSLLQERGMKVRGYEPSVEAIALAPHLLRRSIVNVLSSQHDDWYNQSDTRDLVICREVLEHVPIVEISRVVADLFEHAKKYVYITTRFTDAGVFDAETDFDTDPTHITCLSQPFLRALCVLNGGRRRADLEAKLDHMNKGRVLVYEVTL